MNTATYCPEDNKLRLYVGRVPRDEYLALRAEGWTATPKQACNFVATWTPARRDRCYQYADIIEDEDQTPEERAADRAERFGDYRDKRLGEAEGYADAYEGQPSAHGYQNQARAERAARRHDRLGGRAVDAWEKAEYWTHRTAGVIRHALYKSTPGVRMGRIKELEAALRKERESLGKYANLYACWLDVKGEADPEKQTEMARMLASCHDWHWGHKYKHPRTGREGSLYDLMREDYEDPITGAEAWPLWLGTHAEPEEDNDWTRHYTLRLAYENQMLEAQGGRAAFVEMVPGGWIGGHQIRRVHKSNKTGRVVSVEVMGKRTRFTKESGYREQATRPGPVVVNIERYSKDVYRPPTPEDLEALKATFAAEKAARPEKPACPLINPTDEDAERLIKLWNERRRADFDKRHGAMAKHYEFKPSRIERITQAVYSANSKGSYARAETQKLCSLGRLEERQSFCDYEGQRKRAAEWGPALCQIRVTGFDPYHVIILTDKPQKPLPAAVWEPYQQPAGVEEQAAEGVADA